MLELSSTATASSTSLRPYVESEIVFASATNSKDKEIDLKEKLLKEIYSLEDESSKIELIVELVSKVTNRWNKDHKGHKVGKEIIGNVLSVSSNYTKIKGLIEIYNYLDKLEKANIEPIIIDLILAMENKKAKFSLVDEFIEVPYLKFLPRDLADRIQGNFELLEQVRLMGKHFSMWLAVLNDDYPQHYSLYKTEKSRIIDEAKTITNNTYKYSVLIRLLEEFPLEKEEKTEISTLALGVLWQLSNSKQKGSTISVKDKIKLMPLLTKEQNKVFSSQVYSEIMKEHQINSLEKLETLLTFSRYCYRRFENGIEDYELSDKTEREIANTLDYLCNDKGRQDQEHFALIKFLIRRTCLGKRAIALTENIKCQITKVDASLFILLGLEKNKLKEDFVSQTLKMLSSIGETEKRLILSIRLVRHLKGKRKKSFIASLMAQISLLLDEAKKAELLANLLPYLTYKQAKEAFEVVEEIESGFNRAWASVAYVKYLAKGKSRQIIHNATEVLEACASPIEKICVMKQLIRFGLDNQSNSDI